MFERITWVATAIALCISPTAAVGVDDAVSRAVQRDEQVTVLQHAPITGDTETIRALEGAVLKFPPAAIKVTVPPVVAARVGPVTSHSKSGPRSYSFRVPLAGHQGAINRCAGFVWEDYSPFGHVVSAHNYCGGAVILRLHVGDTVRLTGHGAGTYRVASIKVVPKGSRSRVLEGKLWMQTCFFDRPSLRLVQLVKVD